MAKEKNLEYERVDGKTDKYKRVLVKFNPKFLRGSDFELEFIPLGIAIYLGRTLVTEIDSMSTIDLYQWVSRQVPLEIGSKDEEPGTIIPIELDQNRAEIATRVWRSGRGGRMIEPRQIVGRVKRWFDEVKSQYNEQVSLAYSYFLYCGQLGSLPFLDDNFTVERVKTSIEELTYPSINSGGEEVERSLVDHLFDVHKTEHVADAIKLFLFQMLLVQKGLMEEAEKEKS